MKIYLKNQKSYKWINNSDIYFHGYIIYNETLYEGKAAIDVMKNCLEGSDYCEQIKLLNGSFACICEQKDRIICVVDKLRTFPLYWTIIDGELYVGDDGEAIVNNIYNPVVNIHRVNEYLSSELFVANHNTLIDGFFQLKAGEMAIYNKMSKNIEICEYFHYHHDENFGDNVDAQIIEKFWYSYNKAAKNLIMALKGRTAVVPLSGGADSRMVLRMLKTNNYEKVICYTYGYEGNAEVEISRKVAAEFGYKWVLAPYSRKMWKQLRNNRQIHDYEKNSFNFCSSPHLADFPAVMYLKDNNLIPKDSVFIPGHSGDLVAGSHIRKEFLEDKFSYKDFINSLEKKFYPGKTFDEQSRKELNEYFSFCSNYNNHQLASEAEWFNMQERQSKFIINSVRVYEFFGYEWLVPLWDNNIMDFWQHVPLDYRFKRKLYFMAVHESLPSTNDNSLKKRIAANVRKIPVINSIVRRARRLKSYFKSPFAISNYIPLNQYLLACIKEQPTFEIYTLTSKIYVRDTIKRFSSNKNNID